MIPLKSIYQAKHREMKLVAKIGKMIIKIPKNISIKPDPKDKFDNVGISFLLDIEFRIIKIPLIVRKIPA